MKKSTLILVLLVAAAFTAAAAKIRTLNVQMKNSEVRSSKSPFASVVATLPLGSSVEVLEGDKKSTWAKVSVKNKGVTGWMYMSSLTSGRVRMASGDENARMGASAAELKHAGKYFNKDAEAGYRKKNSKADFTWVDKIEKDKSFKVSARSKKKFVKDGGLVVKMGGAR